METIRWGILGAGRIAATMAEDFQHVGHADLVAIGSRSAAKAEAFAARYAIPTAYGSYGELLDDPTIDVVYIATPHPQHHGLALAAIERGKAVLVEKAFTATLAGAREVIEVARARDVFCMEAMWTRFLPAVAAAREIVAWGRIGDVLGASGDLYAQRAYDPGDRLFSPELGGGSLLDLGVYAVSFANAFLGSARSVHCEGRYAPNGVDQAAAITIKHRAGGLSALTCALDGFGPARMTILGSKGWLEVEPRFHHPTTISIHRNGILPRVIEVKPHGRGYAHEIAEVTQLVAGGHTESATMPLADTLEVMRILDDCLTQLGIEHREAPVSLG
ncbi:MAG: Gfo/Idh/MocA family protein [Arachnia sp.]